VTATLSTIRNHNKKALSDWTGKRYDKRQINQGCLLSYLSWYTFKSIFKEFPAIGRPDGFRMKLHAFNWQATVSYAHYFPFFIFCTHFKTLWQRICVYDK